MDLGSINNIDQQPSAKDNTRFVAILQAHPLLEYLLGQTTLKLNVLIFDPVPLEFTGLTILFSTGFKSTRCIPVVYIVDGQIGRKQFGQDLYREFRVQSKFEWIIPLNENNGKPSNLTPSHIRATTFLVTEYVKSSAYSSEDVNTNKISVSKDQNKRNHVTQVALSENFSIILKGLLQPIINNLKFNGYQFQCITFDPGKTTIPAAKRFSLELTPLTAAIPHVPNNSHDGPAKFYWILSEGGKSTKFLESEAYSHRSPVSADFNCDYDSKKFRDPDPKNSGSSIPTAQDNHDTAYVIGSSHLLTIQVRKVRLIHRTDIVIKPLVADENTPLDALSSHGRNEEFLKTFHDLLDHRIPVSKQNSTIIQDSGASMSIIGDIYMLDNVAHCSDISIFPAFGEDFRWTASDTMGAFKLSTLFIQKNSDQTIVSVSQLSKRGHVCVFTTKSFRVFTADSVPQAMSMLASREKEVMRGAKKHGFFVISSF